MPFVNRYNNSNDKLNNDLKILHDFMPMANPKNAKEETMLQTLS